MTAEEKQVLVTFVTKLPEELHVPTTEVAVPASLKRYGLSQIINHLLGLDPVRPFDFIIDGELLRKTLEQHLLEHSISPESIVEVEYVPAVVPPKPDSAIPQDDWVTAVAAEGAAAAAGGGGGGSGGCLASGSADGVVRLWDGAGECLQEFAAHQGGVNALTSLAAAPSQQHHSSTPTGLLLSAGKDHKLKLWSFASGLAQQQQNGSSKKGSGGSSSMSAAHCVADYQGHKEAVQAVAANPASSLCCSGGWDGQLLLWKTGAAVVDEAAGAAAGGGDGDDTTDAAASRKKRRVAAANGSSAAVAAAPLRLQPVASLPGHVHCVSAVCWSHPDVVYSGGWDHSVRRYDVESHTNTDTYNGSKAVYAVAAPSDSSSSSSVVAFGGSDRVLRVWDSRGVSGEGLAVKAYAAHEGWISSVAWRPGSSYHVAIGGHDGAVKLWDIRTAVPLGSLQQHKENAKVLCVGWWGDQTLVSGGSDCKVQLYRLP